MSKNTRRQGKRHEAGYGSDIRAPYGIEEMEMGRTSRFFRSVGDDVFVNRRDFIAWPFQVARLLAASSALGQPLRSETALVQHRTNHMVHC